MCLTDSQRERERERDRVRRQTSPPPLTLSLPDTCADLNRPEAADAIEAAVSKVLDDKLRTGIYV